MARAEPKKRTEKMLFLLRALERNLEDGDITKALRTLNNIGNEVKIVAKDLRENN